MAFFDEELSADVKRKMVINLRWTNDHEGDDDDELDC